MALQQQPVTMATLQAQSVGARWGTRVTSSPQVTQNTNREHIHFRMKCNPKYRITTSHSSDREPTALLSAQERWTKLVKPEGSWVYYEYIFGFILLCALLNVERVLYWLSFLILLLKYALCDVLSVKQMSLNVMKCEKLVELPFNTWTVLTSRSTFQ